MHRFGRTSSSKTKDRWGGSFILAAILALVGAWFAGQYLGGYFNGNSVATNPPGVSENNVAGTLGNSLSASVEPAPFQLQFVQVASLRSEASAKKLARSVSERYPTMVGAMTKDGFFPVWAGPFTDAQAVEAAKATLNEDAATKGAFIQRVAVDYNPTATPVAAMAGKTEDVRKGLDTLNTYLHQAALWMENKANGSPADTAVLKELGQKLSDSQKSMAAEKQGTGKQIADMLSAATANAAALEQAANSPATGDDYQAAMSGYLSVLSQYRSIQP